MNEPVLYIGNKNYSSWSMRPWLALRWGGIRFEERVIPLGGPAYGKSVIPEILAVSPSGRVPALHLQGAVVWDSLAICEWAAEQNHELYPAEGLLRAQARSVVAEMHAGFAGVRRELSMNLRRRGAPPKAPIGDDARRDIARIEEIWMGLRQAHSGAGPFLFGGRGIVDAFFAPVCTRFRSYGVSLSPVSQSYCDAIFADPDFAAWEAAALEESWTIEQTDSL